MAEAGNIRDFFAAGRVCVVVPTYQNAGTIVDVLRRVLLYCSDVIVVDDGCTDETAALIRRNCLPVEILTHKQNLGKGAALRSGLRRAAERGFLYAATIDSDGQHYPEDLELIAKAMDERPGALVVGSRNLRMENMPARNTFANRFSNFWFRLQTWQPLSDTQSGFRLYPLRNVGGMRVLTSRYEAELELLVFTAWRGTPIVEVPVRVYYPPAAERISHFRPAADFMRISLLNTILCVLALVYGWPRMVLTWLTGQMRRIGSRAGVE